MFKFQTSSYGLRSSSNQQLSIPKHNNELFKKSFQYSGVSNYCKRGYFRWGKISRKRGQDISCGGNFHDTAPIFFIRAYGFYFRVGVIFAKKRKARKTRKLPPRENFHVYSIWNNLPLNIRKASTPGTFKHKLHEYKVSKR